MESENKSESGFISVSQPVASFSVVLRKKK
jgi:hypothetical protein